MSSIDKKTIQEFWTKNVPGWDIVSKKFSPEEKEFYIEIDKFRIKYEPSVPPLLDSIAEKEKLSLEIGCGIGYDSRYMAKKGAKVISLDLSFNNAYLALKGMHLLGLLGRSICADAERLPFKDNIFDVVYSFGVLHHTPDTQSAINEIHRVLKPDGKSVVMLYHKGYVYYLLLLLHGYKLIFGIYNREKLMSRYDNTPLSKMYSNREARRLFRRFKDINFEVTTYGGIQNNPKLRWVWVLFNKIPFLMKHFGSFLVIKAVK
jgi:ubiquinone/menaquinone biosynthesis C-methylase UbiE